MFEIDKIRLNYRLAKSAELARMVIDQKLVSFARVYLTSWHPAADEAERKRQNTKAKRVVDLITKADSKARAKADKADDGDRFAVYQATFGEIIDGHGKKDDSALIEKMERMVVEMQPARNAFETHRKSHRKLVEKAVKELPAYAGIEAVNGFGAWGLGTLIGEAGDIGEYPGCRNLFKRLGLAPNDCYPRGEKSTGRMIPRKARGRVMGIIADPLLKHKAKNAYGTVYDTNKARHLEAGKAKGHAHNLARRAMVKALIHDVHRAWSGKPLDYVFSPAVESHGSDESHHVVDLPAGESSNGTGVSPSGPESQKRSDHPGATLNGSGASQHRAESHQCRDRPAPTFDAAPPPDRMRIIPRPVQSPPAGETGSA